MECAACRLQCQVVIAHMDPHAVSTPRGTTIEMSHSPLWLMECKSYVSIYSPRKSSLGVCCNPRGDILVA